MYGPKLRLFIYPEGYSFPNSRRLMEVVSLSVDEKLSHPHWAISSLSATNLKRRTDGHYRWDMAIESYMENVRD